MLHEGWKKEHPAAQEVEMARNAGPEIARWDGRTQVRVGFLALGEVWLREGEVDKATAAMARHDVHHPCM